MSSADAAIEAKLLSAVADFLGKPPQKQDGADQVSVRSSLLSHHSVQREERKIGEVHGKVIRRVPKARGIVTTMKDKIRNSSSTISKGNSTVAKLRAQPKLTGEISGGYLDSTEKSAKGLAIRSQPLPSLSTINSLSTALDSKNRTQPAGGSRRIVRRKRPLPPSRDSRFLSLFTMVSFPNILCTTTTQLNGTCYPPAECQNRRGTPQVCRGGWRNEIVAKQIEAFYISTSTTTTKCLFLDFVCAWRKL